MRDIRTLSTLFECPERGAWERGIASPAHPDRTNRRGTALLPLLLACLLPLHAGAAVEADEEQPTGEEAGLEGGEAPTSSPVRPIRFQAPTMPEEVAEGLGRLTLRFDGNRRWCTYPDDRPVKPTQAAPQRGTKERRRGQVFTFGYQFTVAAIRRGDPTSPQLLYESPLIRTASMRNAAKLGRSERSTTVGPGVGGGGRPPTGPKRADMADGLVPYWQERYRCTTVDETFQFDLAEGTYDIYAAFDLMGRRGAWSHRTIAFIEEVPIKSGRRTVLDGVLDLRGARQRDLEFLRATITEAGSPDPADAP